MLLRQLDYFIKVVDNQSFTKAADAAFISQSAVSQQIQALEQELDVKLLKRHNRSFSLTSAGNYLYRHGPALLAAADQLKKATINVGKHEVGELMIGYPKNYDGVGLGQVVSSFSQLFPQIQLNITAEDHVEMLRKLQNKELDIVFVDDRCDLPTDFHQELLLNSRYFVEICSENQVANQTSVTLNDVANKPCIVVCSKDQVAEEVRFYREKLGVDGEFKFVDSLAEAQMLVAANQGYLLVSEIGHWQPTSSLIKRVAVTEPAGYMMVQPYCVLWQEEQITAAVDEFIQLLMNILRNTD